MMASFINNIFRKTGAWQDTKMSSAWDLKHSNERKPELFSIVRLILASPLLLLHIKRANIQDSTEMSANTPILMEVWKTMCSSL